MEEITKLIKQIETFNIKIQFIKMEGPAFFLPKASILFVNIELSEQETIEVLDHEHYHIKNHFDIWTLYNSTEISHSKMEHEADDYMISKVIERSEGYYDYSNILEYYKLGMGWEDKLKKLST